METGASGKLLRVYVGEQDKVGGRPVYEAIVAAAHAEGLAGATVLRGVSSFGGTRQLHTAKVLRLSENLPLVIEIVDSAERVAAFLPTLATLLRDTGSGGLVTQEAVEVWRFGREAEGPS